MATLTRRQRRRRWLQPFIGVAAVLLVYYAWPVRQEGRGLVLGVLLTIVGVGLIGWAIAVQVRRHIVGGEPVGLPALVTLLGAVLVVFATGYYRLEISDPGQMDGLETKTDSLYFTMQLLTTVGLGDVSAQGQPARTLALVQMAFDLVFVAAGGSLLAGSVKERIGKREGTGPESQG